MKIYKRFEISLGLQSSAATSSPDSGWVGRGTNVRCSLEQTADSLGSLEFPQAALGVRAILGVWPY